jgi:hypothetical protein
MKLTLFNYLMKFTGPKGRTADTDPIFQFFAELMRRVSGN